MKRSVVSARHAVLLAFLAIASSGCASSTVRDYAAVLATDTNRLNDEIEGLDRSRRQIEATRERLSNTMQLSTLEAERYTQRRLAEWAAAAGVGNKAAEQRQRLFQSVRAHSDAAASQAASFEELSSKLQSASGEAKGRRSAKLAEASGYLATLSREPSLEDNLKFIASYAGDVADGVKKARKDAAAAEAGASAAAKKLESGGAAPATTPRP
jgi:hypothetical protein